MDPDGVTNWLVIGMCFGYAGIGWLMIAGAHFWIRRRRRQPAGQQGVATGYGESWRSNSQSNF
ncbi:MAG: hypothetical protein IPP14_08440 [Planctomycetes bacterium]|nr:hypothetical protein [Planctomycetota bacterium]